MNQVFVNMEEAGDWRLIHVITINICDPWLWLTLLVWDGVLGARKAGKIGEMEISVGATVGDLNGGWRNGYRGDLHSEKVADLGGGWRKVAVKCVRRWELEEGCVKWGLEEP